MFTKSVLEAIGIKVMTWPINSPNLNPIEALWDDIKDYIQAHYPDVHSSYKRLREAVKEAWESISHERVKELVRSMRERCFAVIRARGWYTKY
jgi:transposase